MSARLRRPSIIRKPSDRSVEPQCHSSATESIQDRGYVVGQQSAAGQHHHQKCAAAIDRCNSCRFRAQPWCYHWQSAVTGRTCCCSLPQRLLRATTTSSSSAVTVYTDAAKTLVHAFVSSRLDYCNGLLHGVSEGLLHCVQSVQNAVAGLVNGARRRDHITPILQQLHWLPAVSYTHLTLPTIYSV